MNKCIPNRIHSHMIPFITLLVILQISHATGTIDDLKRNQITFSDALTSQLYKKKNECTSTWGISLMFSLLYPGSTDDTTLQIQNVLGYPNSTTNNTTNNTTNITTSSTTSSTSTLVWNDTSTALDTAYDGQCADSYMGYCFAEAPVLEIANSVWVDEDTTLEEDYTNVVGDYVHAIDFRERNAGETVNEWVTNATHGMIDSIVEDGPLPYKLIALNSIYLKASWKYAFEEQHTNEDVFYTSPSRTKRVKDNAYFMHMVDFFRYSHTAVPGYQILKLPYADSDLSMILALPMTAQKIPPHDVALQTNTVLSALNSLENTQVAIAMPKFKFESSYEKDLKSSLESLGLKAPFNPREGFCAIFPDGCLPLSIIVQKTSINVNEMGTEAAAVTGGFMAVSMPEGTPTLFMADHPFSFYIYDSKEHIVIFEGRVGEPEIPPGAYPAELKSKHKDKNFWRKNFWISPVDPTTTGDDSIERTPRTVTGIRGGGS